MKIIAQLDTILNCVMYMLEYPISIWGYTFNFLQVWISVSLLAILVWVMFKIVD